MTTENQTLQQLLAERVTAFANGDRPREIIDKLHALTTTIMKDKDFIVQMGKIGGEVMDPLTPAQYDDFIKGEITRNQGIAKAAGIQAK